MIWREIKIGVFIFGLCILAALVTVAIYEHASGTMTSAWLLLPLFILIAVAIIASELLLKKAGANDSAQVSPVSVTWPPGQTVGFIATISTSAEWRNATTGIPGQAMQSTEERTYS